MKFPPITHKLAETLELILNDRISLDEARGVLMSYQILVNVVEKDEAQKRYYEPGNYG